MEKICPKCGRIYMCPPALSREDNKTDICPVCGTIEALDAWPFISEEGRRQVIEVTEKAEIENGRVKPLCKKDTDSRNK